MNSVFQDFFGEITPVKLREPLAETLGAFKKENPIIEYTYIDVVKLAGHACPTTAAAYVCCQEALAKLYPDGVPVRGEISVTVYGEPDDGVYGVMAQIFTLITGAAPASGFRGLGHKYKRKDLLQFKPVKPDHEAMCFEFKRGDNGKTVLVKFYPQQIPFPEEKARRLGKLLTEVIWEVASPKEKKEFQELWLEKVKDMLLKRKGIDKWLKLEEGRN